MNPQEQPTTPTPSNGLGTTPVANQTPGAENESATMQAIEALEAEEPTLTDVPQPAATPASAPTVSSEPAAAATSLEPAETPGAVPTTPVVGGQTTSTPDTSPVEASAAGVAAGLGAQAATTPTQASTFASAPVVEEKKKASKLPFVLVLAALVVVGAIVGFLVWQSM